MIASYVILGFTFCGAIWCIGSMVQLERLDTHYQKNVSKPWQAAIATHDWDACDRFKEAAERHINNMGSYAFNPLKWFKVPD